MKENRIMEIILNYGDEFDPSQDMNMAEALNIIESCQTRMEIAENAYLYGHMRGSCRSGLTRQVPLYDIKQLSDEEWNRLVARNKAERLVAV